MMRRYISLFLLCFTPLSFAGVGAAHINERDLYLGEAFYYANQDKYFDAITRLDIAFERFYGLDKRDPKLNPLHFQFGYSQYSLGDLESSYRMFQRARRAFTAVFDSNVDQSIRNEAAYQLARLSLKNGEPAEALQNIKKISGKVPESIREDELFLRAQIYMANGDFVDAAKTLREMKNAEGYKGFAAYNLGVALIKIGQEKEGLEQLEMAGKISGDDDVSAAIRDKANLALGYRMMEKQTPALAKRYLDRVRLSGPFSNKALLGSGWADVALGNFESALAPWSVLVKRNATDKSVQESLLGVPYAYAKLNLPGKAASMYGKAIKEFEQESTRLEASIKSVQEGSFLRALLHDEMGYGENWIARLKSLPQKPETFYLLELMAADDFQESLKNYLDLDELSKKLGSWDEDLKSYEEMLGLRRKYFDALLPSIDMQFVALDSRTKLLLKRRQNLDDRIKTMLESSPSEYENLIAEANKQLQQTNDDINNLQKSNASFGGVRQLASQSLQGYDEQIRQLKSRVHDSRQKVDALRARQGQIIEALAGKELRQRREHLQEYQAQARFALAESYERASKKQSPVSGVK